MCFSFFEPYIWQITSADGTITYASASSLDPSVKAGLSKLSGIKVAEKVAEELAKKATSKGILKHIL